MMLQTNGKMFFFLTASEEDQPPLKCIDTHGYFRAMNDRSPGFGHGRVQIDVIKNKEGAFLLAVKELLKILKRLFLTVTSVYIYQIEGCMGCFRKEIFKDGGMYPCIVKPGFFQGFGSVLGGDGTSFYGMYFGGGISQSQCDGTQPQGSPKFKYGMRLKVLDQTK